MMELPLFQALPRQQTLDYPGIMHAIAENSARPRYTFMVLDLIARVAGERGQAGPQVRDGDSLVPIREWLSNAIAPSAARHYNRRSTAEKVRRSMTEQGVPTEGSAEARQRLEDEIACRVRLSGMTAVSRAVSELVKAGLIKRHYQGFRVDHENRGAQRHVVYTVPPQVLAVLERRHTG